MRISITNVLVNDLDKALTFYTDILGFVKKTEIPMGETKWITVVSKDDLQGVELLLEPIAFEPAEIYQRELYEAGIPYTSFQVNSLDYEYERLRDLNVDFSMPPTTMGTVKMAIIDDTCGNKIQLIEVL